MATLLVSDFDFPSDNVIRLIDKDGTRENILKEYLRFTKDIIEPDDRLVIFYAGHGYTDYGKRGEVGLFMCKDYHTSREEFCNQCHNASSVYPDCYGCHYYP